MSDQSPTEVVETLLAGASPGACILLTGHPGSGKTAQLYRFTDALRTAGRTVVFDVDAADSRAAWLAIDDLHTRDAATLDALAAALDGGRINLLAATEPREQSDALRRIASVAARSSSALRHPPLTTADILDRAGSLSLRPTSAAIIRRRSLGVAAVVDQTLRALSEQGDSDPAQPVTDQRATEAVTTAAAHHHHRTLRRLDADSRSVLTLAALRRPVDVHSVALTLDLDPEAALLAIDVARGSGYLNDSDVFPGAVVDTLTGVVGAAAVNELRARSISVGLSHRVIGFDEAMSALAAGLDDPRLVDVVLDAVDTVSTAQKRAAVGLLARIVDVPAASARVAAVAVRIGDLDTASALTDDLLTRYATNAGGFTGIDDVVDTAARVAWGRGHVAHAATLYRWLGGVTGRPGTIDSMIADVAAGGTLDDADQHALAAPTGGHIATGLFRDGMRHGLNGDAASGVALLTQAISMNPRPTAGYVAPDIWVATMLAVAAGEDAGHLAGFDSTGLLARFVAVTDGTTVPASQIVPSTPRDRFLDAATTLRHARRTGDAAALRDAWDSVADVVRMPFADLFMLVPLAEIKVAARQLGLESTWASTSAAVDQMLRHYPTAPGWAAGWFDQPPRHDEPHPPPTNPGVGGLTDREAEVAGQLLAGFTYREIGENLYISAKTVEHHVSRIRRRLDAGSRSELLAALRAAGYEAAL